MLNQIKDTHTSGPNDAKQKVEQRKRTIHQSNMTPKREKSESLVHSESSLGSLQAKVEQSHLTTVTLIAKFGKEKYALEDLAPDTTIRSVKKMLQERTRILPKRQKLVGLIAKEGGAKGVIDELTLKDLNVKGKASGDSTITHHFILMGTPEEEIFVDPQEREDLPDVIDDFDLDFNAGSDEWLQHVANGENLKKFTEHTEVFIMNPPRESKPLLVLDLDHTLLDFSSRELQRDQSISRAVDMKRPFMDQFLTKCYQNYDLVVW